LLGHTWRLKCSRLSAGVLLAIVHRHIVPARLAIIAKCYQTAAEGNNLKHALGEPSPVGTDPRSPRELVVDLDDVTMPVRLRALGQQLGQLTIERHPNTVMLVVLPEATLSGRRDGLAAHRPSMRLCAHGLDKTLLVECEEQGCVNAAFGQRG
jgi:hypothetical protein